jgi:hypothetical protein
MEARERTRIQSLFFSVHYYRCSTEEDYEIFK